MFRPNHFLNYLLHFQKHLLVQFRSDCLKVRLRKSMCKACYCPLPYKRLPKQGDTDEQKRQERAQSVRRRRSLRKLNDKQKEKIQKTLDTAAVVSGGLSSHRPPTTPPESLKLVCRKCFYHREVCSSVFRALRGPTLAAGAYQNNELVMLLKPSSAITYSMTYTNGNCGSAPNIKMQPYAQEF